MVCGLTNVGISPSNQIEIKMDKYWVKELSQFTLMCNNKTWYSSHCNILGIDPMTFPPMSES